MPENSLQQTILTSKNPGDTMTIQNSWMGSQILSGAQHKSLHMPFKKKEAFRIEEENNKLIDRIMNAHSSIKFRDYESDFNKHLQIKKQIKKSDPIPLETIIRKKKKM